jgi:DNA-binding response OmpR family regulator
VIMITALGTADDKIKGLDVGADDYLTKPFNFDELLARLRVQLRRAKPAAQEGPAVLSFGDVELDPVRHALSVNGFGVNIRPKEFQLLATLAANPQVLFSRVKLTSLVWGTDYMGSSRTIDVHIQRLREKVEKLSNYKFIKTVHGLGYRFELTPKAAADEN